jgi:lysophospholipase L1-like esterase
MSRNLFNIETLESDAYTAPISCISGQIYRTYRMSAGGFNTQYRILDSEKNILNTVTSSARGYTIPTEASYVQVHILGGNSAYSDTVVIEGTHCYDWYETYGEMHNYTKSKLNGKRWLVLGDSISTGDGVLGGYQYASEPYHYILGKKYGMIVTNKSVSGYTTDNLYNNKVLTLKGNYIPDLITIFIGTNDCSYSVDLITPYRNMITKLKELYPNAKIGLICPIDRRDQKSTLVTYVRYVEQVANEFKLPCLNMFKKEGWDFTNENDIATYTCVSSSGSSSHDGLHPNNLGHKLLTDNHIEQFISDLIS